MSTNTMNTTETMQPTQAYVLIAKIKGTSAVVGVYDGIYDGSNLSIIGTVTVPAFCDEEDVILVSFDSVNPDLTLVNPQFVSVAPDHNPFACHKVFLTCRPEDFNEEEYVEIAN
jgi:hypothetical protein